MKHKKFLITLALLGGLTALTGTFLALSGQAAPMRQIPQVLHVAPDGMCGGVDPCFASVQAAVDAAAHSDEIRIATGNYTDTHVRSSDAVTQVAYVSKTLTLRGGYTTANALAGPPDPDANPTTLDAQGRGRVFYISGDVDVTIEGLRITGGDARGLGGDPLAPTSDVGGGVYGISATVRLRDCQVSGNMAPAAGGGVYLHSGDLALLTGNTVLSNTTQGTGGGVHISWTEIDARLDGNTLYDNEAGLGGGVYLWYSHAELDNNTIHSNQANDGAGVYVWAGTSHVVWLSENVIFDNVAARWGGGVHLWDSRDVTLYGNSIFSNTAQVYGGGVWLNFSLATLASNAIHHNQALAGGGVYVRAGSALKTSRVGASPRHVAGGTPPRRDDGPTLLINNAIVENQASDEGSGLYIAGANSRLLHNTIARNGSTGGTGSVGDSSGVYVTTFDQAHVTTYQGTPALYSTVALTNTLLAEQAVGIGVAGPNTLTVNGVLWHNTPVTVSLGTASLLLAQNQHTGDPAFASDGYHLMADSAAIDKGVYAGVTYDIDGDARALEQPDLGADEWQRRVYLPIALNNHDPGTNIENLVSTWSEGVAMADVNGDGHLDVFIAHRNAAETVWLNDGTGSFDGNGQDLGDGFVTAVALGDVDHDGDADAFVTGLEGNTVWLNDGTGTFIVGQSLVASLSENVALGDMDGDGDLDAFVANRADIFLPEGQANQVWLNDGGGILSDSGQSLGNAHSRSVALGDLDADGDLDAFVANSSGHANTVWLNDGTGTFVQSQSLGSAYSRGVALGDVDGDGDLDAFVTNRNAQANTVWLNDGMGTFSDSGQRLGDAESMDVALGDVDGDGDVDAVVANGNHYDQANIVWLNDGRGVFSDDGHHLGNADSQTVALGDVDGDGKLEALFANYNQATRIWLDLD
jgi:hypothetical protein